MKITNFQSDPRLPAQRILDIGTEEIPDHIRALRRTKELSRLMVALNRSLRSSDLSEARTARAALDHLGFL